jgi:PBP1b-binding outer membrane lipoprotein LpoB
MKAKISISLLLMAFSISSCVQKTYNRVVVVTLDVSKVKDVQSVGIRGEGKPLSWNEDYPMEAVVKDSLYKAVLTAKTGYLFAEAKFTVNGNFELQDKPNRRINFDTKKDTTYVNLIFNKE